MTIKLWHCCDTRSLRVLWTLEEIGCDYELKTLSFPPRQLEPNFLEINPQGTIPFMTHGSMQMTESVAMCQYLVDRYKATELKIAPEHKEYGRYLNWLFSADTTYTFPLALALRYGKLESKERQQAQIVEDYSRYFHAKLRDITAHLTTHDYLCDNRFTLADITLGYAIHFAEVIGLGDRFKPEIIDYLTRIRARPAFIKAQSLDGHLNFFK